MNALFSVITHSLATLTLLLEDLLALLTAKCSRDQIDGRRKVECSRCRRNGRPRIQELLEVWRTCDTKIKGKVFSSENEATQWRFGIGAMSFGKSMANDIGYKVEIRSTVDFWNNKGVEVLSFEDLGQVVEGIAAIDRIVADSVDGHASLVANTIGIFTIEKRPTDNW
ncbi:hypothetical protein KCU81_g853, partial [Aureobasidium melanogenum]